MLVSVGGCGSSGSTFFSLLLNKHPDIVCGEELRFLSKPIMYNNYKKVQRFSFLLKKYGISSYPYADGMDIFTNLNSYKLTEEVVWNWIKTNGSFEQFLNKFKAYLTKLTDKDIWMEKTPNNIYTAEQFLNNLQNVKFIHVVRDPRDVILSLLGKNNSITRAAEKWLISVAMVQKLKGKDEVLEIKYEDLIENSEEALRKVCSFLNIEFNMEFFFSDQYISKHITRRNKKFNSWNLSPEKGFSSDSIKKYDNCKFNFELIYSQKITKDFARKTGVKRFSLQELAEIYEYEIPNEDKFNLKNIANKRGGQLYKKKLYHSLLLEDYDLKPRTIY